MPGADQDGYAGVTDEVNNHYLRTFGTAGLMSLISAGQMVARCQKIVDFTGAPP